MPNTVSGFYQTLVAAASEASATLVGQTTFLDQVQLDYKPEAATLGQTLNVVIPSQTTGSVTDIGLTDFTITDTGETTVPIVFNSHPALAYVIRDFEQFNSPLSIRAAFLDSYIKGIAEYVNTDIVSLITPTNFNSYTPLQSAIFRQVDGPSMIQGVATLANAKVPVGDLGNFFLTAHPTPYFNMAGATFWSANSQVGYQIATEVRRKAMLGEQFGAMTEYDQAMPGNVATAVTGTSVGVTSASTAVTGSGTAFSTQLAVGEWLVFASDVTQTGYQIATITSNTAIVLTAPFVGSTNAATQATFETYTSFLYHRRAIALAVRPLPEPDGRVVDYSYIFYKGLPIRIQLGYNQIKGGWVVTLDAGYGKKVVRKDHGILLK
jgi:hypothetical protein